MRIVRGLFLAALLASGCTLYFNYDDRGAPPPPPAPGDAAAGIPTDAGDPGPTPGDATVPDADVPFDAGSATPPDAGIPVDAADSPDAGCHV